jgi:hypothetical protein
VPAKVGHSYLVGFFQDHDYRYLNEEWKNVGALRAEEERKSGKYAPYKAFRNVRLK